MTWVAGGYYSDSKNQRRLHLSRRRLPASLLAFLRHRRFQPVRPAQLRRPDGPPGRRHRRQGNRRLRRL
ncbi:MAG: hypothetical protein WDN45_04110 [Caulobacteraceae bacterium]